MIWILSVRGAATRLRAAPFTETAVAGVHSVVYRPGVEPLAHSGADPTVGALGTFARGVSRVSGLLFVYDGAAAETLFATTQAIDVIVRYRAAGEVRRRTFVDVIFVGDAAVTFPSRNTGLPELIGVPFRVQIPSDETLAQHVVDETDS